MIPKKIVVLGQTYKVVAVTDPEASIHRDATRNALGVTDQDLGLIKVRAAGDESSPTQERDTVLHEILHAIFYLGGLKVYLDEEVCGRHQEEIVAVLATHLLDVLRRNRGLAEYLTSNG